MVCLGTPRSIIFEENNEQREVVQMDRS